jgi:hypothetical protein
VTCFGLVLIFFQALKTDKPPSAKKQKKQAEGQAAADTATSEENPIVLE